MVITRYHAVMLTLGTLLVLPACDGSDSPAAPTTAPTTPESFTLSGSVTGLGTAPLDSATVEILDGDHAGVSAQTNAEGLYEMTGLTGNVNVRAFESCHSEQRAGTAMTQNRVLDFQLEPSAINAPRQLSPPDGTVFSHFPRTTTMEWSGADCAVSYVLELDCFHCCQANAWCTDVGRTWSVTGDITATSHTINFVGAQPGRWRVWSVDRYGRESAKTGWWEFRYTM
jgi:hypothetical protein